ncbi:FecR family protein [Phytopseudomonas daroniae]|uniref:FecR family protein n=1 Tax=Phytopseudomonas daroniae TaxID=2487519 RepID=UPI0010383142|nr:FecR domain-containing protein [Pseudomonas daroniae]TBU71863.1 iron dicitrate transport regulator FecR [Pseudomonas daroniae]
MSAIPDTILAQAAEWLVQVDAEPASQADFAAWRAAAPQHEAAARNLERMIEQIGALPAAPVQAALRATRQVDRRRGLKRSASALLLCAALLLPAALFLQANPPGYLLADIRTGSGQWHGQVLEDGTQLTLNGHSAVNLAFDRERRTLHLLQGEILVEVASDAARPFVVETAHGSIRALGTRFVVASHDHATQLDMLESRVEVRSGGDTVQVGAGQRLRLDERGIGPLSGFDAHEQEQAWHQHQLLVEDRPLPEVLAALARQRPGYLLFDGDALAHLRVSAVLPLDNPDQALRLLARSFPLQIRHFSPWLVQVRLTQGN